MTESLTFKPEAENRFVHYENGGVISPSEDMTEARFVIPSDEAIVEKFEYIENRLNSWKGTDSSIVGATAFGSATKGYANPETSDVDVTVFVDADQLNLKLEPDLTSATVCWEDWYAFSNKARLPMEYAEKVETVFADPASPNKQLPVNAQVFPLSHDYLKIVASFEVRNAKRLDRYRQLKADGHGTEVDNIADWETVSRDAETLKSLPKLMDALDQEPYVSRHRDVLTVTDFLSKVAVREATEFSSLRAAMFSSNRDLSNLPLRLFNLAISPGLQAYRQTFLNELAASSDPDLVWQFFVKRLAVFEDSDKHPRNKENLQYPRTIEEALVQYA